MRALLCKAYGPPESLVIEELPDPVAGKGEAVVDIAYAALNFFDTLLLQGRYQFKPDMPFSPAAEFSGTVSAVGEGVSHVKVGDRVLGSVTAGAARAKLAVPAITLTKLPEGLSLEKAAGLTITYATTYHALKDRAKIQPGETLAVLGASGGVGLAAVELGKIMGAKVIACASSDEKVAFAKSRGADLGFNYGTGDIKDGLKELTGGKGVDVIYDPVGDKLAEPALRAIAWKGRFLVIGFAGGEIPKIPLNLALLKGCDIVGVFWGGFAKQEPAANAANMAQICAWAADGTLDPAIHAIYPLNEAATALNELANRKAMGKILLKI